MAKKDNPGSEYKKATAAERKRGIQPTVPKVKVPRPNATGRRHPGLYKAK